MSEAAAAAAQHTDMRQCRICLGGPDEELGRLIKPCLCKGSIKYVHVQCLNTWRTTSANTNSFWSCPQCNYKYAWRRTKILGASTSPFVLGPATLFLFLLLVFSSSFIVTFFLPELNDPTSASETPTFEPEPIYSWSVSFGTLGAASDIIRTSVRAFAGLAQRVEDVEVVQEDPHAVPQDVGEDARHGTRTNGGSKSGVRMHNKKHKGTKQVHKKTRRRDPRAAYSPSSEGPSLLVRLVRRFLLGLSLVGIISFISLLLSLSLLAPLQVFRLHFFGNQRNNRNQGGLDGITILVIGFVAIGVVKALHSVYKFNKSAAQYLLLRAENAILEVPDDDNEEERQQVQPLHNTAEPANEEEAREPAPEPKDATASDEAVKRKPRRRPLNLNLNRPARNWEEDDFGNELPATPGGWDEEWT